MKGGPEILAFTGAVSPDVLRPMQILIAVAVTFGIKRSNIAKTVLDADRKLNSFIRHSSDFGFK